MRAAEAFEIRAKRAHAAIAGRVSPGTGEIPSTTVADAGRPSESTVMQDTAYRQILLGRATYKSAALMVLDDDAAAASRHVIARDGLPSCWLYRRPFLVICSRV
ncbi:MAG: hypothetical protein ACRDNF_19210 [Streptosporangiaceae bacterium]